jgi:glycosyltransferase involved in cell wall biosynthesis
LSRLLKADVILPVVEDAVALERSMQSVLEKSGPTLRRLIVVGDPCRKGDLDEMLTFRSCQDARLVFVGPAAKQTVVDSFNRGLTESRGDVVLLGGNGVVGEGWLAELAAVAHAEERTACTTPTFHGEDTASALATSRGTSSGVSIQTTFRAACAGLPRWTVAPVVSLPCIYLRGDVLAALGALDPSYTSLRPAACDWVMRALALGLAAKRANHVCVRFPGLRSADVVLRETSQSALLKRHPHFEPQRERFGRSLDYQLPAHALRIEAEGKLRVALDIRQIPPEQVGTRTYTVSLAQALAELPEIELTLLTRDPAQARGLTGRVVRAEQWPDDVAVIHKPSQVIDRNELRLLFESSAHVVISYLDLIAYRIPLAFASESSFEAYRATSKLTLPAAQRVIAISESVGREITSEFGIPPLEVPVVPLGVESEWFSDRSARDRLIRSVMRLPEQYFFSVASDYPHKNLRNLLDAYALFRSRWKQGEPPWLILAGYSSGARNGLYPRLESEPLDPGVIFLGPISRHQLRVLYQDALALVFSSLYEGFGLPILEAMAAGTPVIAMPISAVPEVGGDCVLYPDGLSAAGLARAMERLASSEVLRACLRAKGKTWVEHFRWEKTARATLEVYRSTVLHPSERSLRMRRLLRDAIIDWSADRPLGVVEVSSECRPAGLPPSVGIRTAWRALQVAVRSRVTKDLRRFPAIVGKSRD